MCVHICVLRFVMRDTIEEETFHRNKLLRDNSVSDTDMLNQMRNENGESNVSPNASVSVSAKNNNNNNNVNNVNQQLNNSDESIHSEIQQKKQKISEIIDDPSIKSGMFGTSRNEEQIQFYMEIKNITNDNINSNNDDSSDNENKNENQQ